MDTQYAHIPENETYRIFRDSKFARAIRDRIASVQADPNWSIHFELLPSNCDVVTIACRDQSERIVHGTPEHGEYIFTRRAHEVYDGESAAPRAQGELAQLEEFLARVKDVVRSSQ